MDTATREAIYVASKTKHAATWRTLRKYGYGIISTWIDEAGPGESTDLADLWSRCIKEASNASAFLLYREKQEVLKGAWVELGAALVNNVPVFAVGIEEFTVRHHKGIQHFGDIRTALAAIRGELDSGLHEEASEKED